MSAPSCPGCNKPLSTAVVNGPAQAVVRCEGCQTLLLWSNGRVMRSAKSSTGTMMGMPAVKVPAEAPLPELKPEADASAPSAGAPKPAPPKTPPPRTATQPLARVPQPRQTVTGIGENVVTKVAAPSAELRKESAQKDPTPPPMKTPPSGPIKTAPPAARKDPTPPPMKTPPSGPIKTAPSGPIKTAPSGPIKTAPSGPIKTAPPPARKDPTPPPMKTPPSGPIKTAPPPAAEADAPHVVAAVAQVPKMAEGDMVDPSAWFAGEVSEVVEKEKLPPLPGPPPPLVDSERPMRAETTGISAAPLPPPPSLTPLEAEPFEIEAPGNEKTPAIGTLMPEARGGDSAPIAVSAREPTAPIVVKAPERPAKTREPSQKIETPAQKIETTPQKIEAREPSQKVATPKKTAASIRGAEPLVPPPSQAPAATDMPSPGTSIGKAPDAPPRATVMGRAAPEPPRKPAMPARGEPVAAAVSMLPPPATAATTERADTTPVKAHEALQALAAPVEHEVSGEPLSSTPPAAAETTAETPLVAQPVTARVPLGGSRRTLFVVAGAAVGVIALVLMVVVMSRGPKKQPATTTSTVAKAPPVVESPKPAPPPTPPPTAKAPPVVESPKPTLPATPTPTPVVATPTPDPPAPEAPAAPSPPRRRRTLGGKKVVLEYDPKPTSPAPATPTAVTPMGEDPATVARAREAYHKGNVKLFAGDSAGAIALYRESLKVYPGYVAGYRGLGLGYEAAGNAEEALKAFHTYVRTVPSANDTPIIRRRIERLESLKQQ